MVAMNLNWREAERWGIEIELVAALNERVDRSSLSMKQETAFAAQRCP